MRQPLAGIVPLDPRPGTVALVCIMIGTAAFDGFSMGSLWKPDVAPHMQQLVHRPRAACARPGSR